MRNRRLNALAATLLMLGLLVVSLALLAPYLFPSEVVRKELETALSQRLRGTASIASLDFDIWTGLQARQVELVKRGTRLVCLDVVTLRYNPWHLLYGKLVITRLVVDGAKVVVDLNAEKVEQASGPPTPVLAGLLPAFPLMLDLQSLVINQGQVSIRHEDGLAADLRDVALRAKLALGPLMAHFSGNATVPDARIGSQSKKLHMPTVMEFAFSMGFPWDTVEAEHISLRTDPALRTILVEEVERLHKDKDKEKDKEVPVDVRTGAKTFDHPDLHRLRTGMNGMELSLQGSVSGFRSISRLEETKLGHLVGPLSIDVDSRASIDMARLSKASTADGIRGQGQVELSMSVLKRPEGPIELLVQLDPRQLTIARGGKRLVKLHGRVTARKVLDWIHGQDGAPAMRALGARKMASEQTSSPSQRRALKLERLDLGAVAISGLSGQLDFERDQLRVENLAMNLLGGQLGGTIVLKGGETFAIETDLAFTRLDLNQLFEPARRVGGDSVVDGVVDVSIALDREQGRIDIERSEGDLALTRIGPDALDRLLVLIDPKGINPSVVGIRSALQDAKPAEVRASLSQGMIGLDMAFDRGLLSSLEVKKIPVGDTTRAHDVGRLIPHWQTFSQALRVVGAERYGVDQQGNLFLE